MEENNLYEVDTILSSPRGDEIIEMQYKVVASSIAGADKKIENHTQNYGSLTIKSITLVFEDIII